MSRINRILVAAIVSGLSTSAFAGSYYESFTVDPNWDQLNNRVAPENYGYSSTDNTGNSVLSPSGHSSAGGEMGGLIKRSPSPANYYAAALPAPLDPDTQAFHADGVMHIVSRGSGSGFNLGFFQGAFSYGSGGDPADFAGINFDNSADAQGMIFTNTQGRDRSGVNPSQAVGQTFPWAIDWTPAPAGSKEKGLLTITLPTGVQNVNFEGDLPNFDPFTHFGIFPVSASTDNAGEVYLDDITITGPGVPEPASLGLLGMAALGLIRRSKR
jgi:hypothetical protein